MLDEADFGSTDVGAGGVAGSVGAGGSVGKGGTGATSGAGGKAGSAGEGTGGAGAGGAGGSGGAVGGASGKGGTGNTGNTGGSTGGTSGKGGTGNTGNTGGTAGAPGCQSCLSSVSSGQCAGAYKMCLGNPQCAQLDACIQKNGCLDAGGGDPNAVNTCVQKACAPFLGGGNPYQGYLDCALCTTPCGGVPACNQLADAVCGTAGTGGGPSTCQPGAKCQPGTGCAGPVPGQPNCSYQCNCGPNGTYQCGESCVGPGGAGGGPAGCTSCVQGAIKSPACGMQQAQCNGQCQQFVSCVLKTNCAQSPNPVQCANQAGCNAPGGSVQAAVNLLNCAECQGCQGICPTQPNQCSGGAGGGPSGCSNCVFSLIQTGGCPAESSKCAQTTGCFQLAQCLQNAGCLSSPDPVACGLTKGCKGTPAATDALTGFLTCAECGQCSNQCSGSTLCGPVSAGAGGSAGAPPQLTCDQCVQQNQDKCAAPINACFSDMECNALLQCMQNGADPQPCYDQFPGGVPGYNAIVSCLACDACPTECAGNVPPDFCGGG